MLQVTDFLLSHTSTFIRVLSNSIIMFACHRDSMLKSAPGGACHEKEGPWRVVHFLYPTFVSILGVSYLNHMIILAFISSQTSSNPQHHYKAILIFPADSWTSFRVYTIAIYPQHSTHASLLGLHLEIILANC